MDNGSQYTHNVINMSQQTRNAAFAPLSQLEAYWDGLRGTRLMPNRAEIDPRGIEQALEFSFIVERIAPGIARMRIAGSHLSDLMGMEVRGMPLTSFIAPNSRRQVSDALEEVFERPATCTVELFSDQSVGLPPLEARMILLPLKSDLGDVSRILGALVSCGEKGRSPRRFEVTDIALRPIVAGTALQLPKRSPKPPVSKPVPASLVTKSPKLVPGFSEPKTEFKTITPRSDAPYLRLVQTDD